MTKSDWIVEAIEKAALDRALAALQSSGELERQLRIMGLSIQQIIWLKHQWQKENPGEEIPGYK